LARDRRPGQSPGGSEATPAARVMVRKQLAAVTEARQLTSCAERTSTTATRCRASLCSSNKRRSWSTATHGIESSNRTRLRRGTPQLTLDTINSLRFWAVPNHFARAGELYRTRFYGTVERFCGVPWSGSGELCERFCGVMALLCGAVLAVNTRGVAAELR